MTEEREPASKAAYRWRSTVRHNLLSVGLVVTAVLVSLALSGVLIALAGLNPIDAARAMIRGVSGTPFAIGNTLNKTTDLLLIALGVIVAARAGLLNIGGEGQLYGGALMALLFALAVTLPTPLHVGGSLVAAAIGGSLVAVIAALLKVKRDVNEVISTLLLNIIMVLFISFLVHGPLMEAQPALSGLPQSPAVPSSARLPVLGNSFITIGIFFAVALAMAVRWTLVRTTFGMRLKLVGANSRAAHHVGVDAARVTIVAFAVSGALCGLGGAAMLLGEQYRLQDGFSPGYGFDGIVVALVARGSPLGAILVALLFGALRAGSGVMESAVGVPSSLVLVTQGLVILFVAAGSRLLSGVTQRSGSTAIVSSP